jgi:hypothetical protein
MAELGKKIVIKGGTYTPTQVTRFTDAYGAQWMTTMSDAYLQPRVFGTHLWHRPSVAVPYKLLNVLPGCHGWLSIDRDKLIFIYNKPNMDGPYEYIVPGYRHTKLSRAAKVSYISDVELTEAQAVTISAINDIREERIV